MEGSVWLGERRVWLRGASGRVLEGGCLAWQASGASVALWPEHSPADAHDALLPPRQICSITGAVWFGKRLEPRGPCGRKMTQLMLMMLSSRLVKSAQSLGRCGLASVWSLGGPVAGK